MGQREKKVFIERERALQICAILYGELYFADKEIMSVDSCYIQSVELLWHFVIIYPSVIDIE